MTLVIQSVLRGPRVCSYPSGPRFRIRAWLASRPTASVWISVSAVVRQAIEQRAPLEVLINYVAGLEVADDRSDIG